MFWVLALLFVVVPIAELYVIVQVAGGIGVPETILLLIAISMAGAWLAKAAGIGVLGRLQRTVRAGKVPSAELVDGGLILFAAALHITPGFLSDCLGILLLLPPTRAIARRVVLSRIRAGGWTERIEVVGLRGRRSSATGAEDSVWDVEAWEDPPERPGLGP